MADLKKKKQKHLCVIKGCDFWKSIRLNSRYCYKHTLMKSRKKLVEEIININKSISEIEDEYLGMTNDIFNLKNRIR